MIPSRPSYPRWRSLPRDTRRAINGIAWPHLARLGMSWIHLRAEVAARVTEGTSPRMALEQILAEHAATRPAAPSQRLG